MITGDLDLERTIWDSEYRRQVIAFLADQGERTNPVKPALLPKPPRSAEVIPFPVAEAGTDAGPRHAAKS